MMDPRSLTELTNSTLSQDLWIDSAVAKLITPMFETKNSAYGGTDGQFHTIREIARRNFPEEYQENEWYAMARVVGVLADKHHIALSKSPGVYENRDRAIDCIVYEFFRLRFIILGDEVEAARTLGNIQRICKGERDGHKDCDCQGRCGELCSSNVANKAS